MLGVRRDTSYNTLEHVWGVILNTPQACEPTLRRSDVSPGEDFGVRIVVSGAQQPGEPGDTYDQKRGGGNEVQGGNPDTSREIKIPSGQGHAHESSLVSKERSPVTRVPAPDVSQKIPCCSANLSHKTSCGPSAQKQIDTCPAEGTHPHTLASLSPGDTVT